MFNVSADDWKTIERLTFSGPGTGAIINVSGASSTHYINFNLGGLAADKVILNFHEATKFEMGGLNFNGSILAPNALVTLNGGNVAGSVIADRFKSEGTTIGGDGFNGYSSPVAAIPEPSTWAMLILGFGAVGVAMRRRRAGAAARLQHA